jgi:hypothetical protein
MAFSKSRWLGLSLSALAFVGTFVTGKDAAAQDDQDTVVVQPAPPAQAAPVEQPAPVVVEQPAPVVVEQPAPVQEPSVVTTAPPGPVEQERETVSSKGGPSPGMLTSGLIVFGVSYTTAAVVGLTSERDSDEHMVVPFAGPWISLAERDGCDVGSEDCDGETAKKVLIGADGVFQAVGGLLVIGAFLNPEERTTSRAYTADTKIRVTPAVGSNFTGLAAFGKF